MAKVNDEFPEKRGPIEKGEKGWPINPFGVVAILFFIIIAVFLIGKPLWERNGEEIISQDANTSGGRIISPNDGEVITAQNLSLELSADEPQKVQKVQFWIHTYADGKWEMIGEKESQPYTLDWQITPQYQNKAVAVTAHILQKDGNIIKDPGGWKEGILILSQ